jgi:uracil-DNA glycosylase family protein
MRVVLAGPPVSPHPQSLAEARQDVMGCHRCDLWRRATQAVFGEGRRRALLMLVGEQPGDVEDTAGEPFVGPAGRLLREALEEAGIPLGRVYLTNAVKHFKWEPRGKRRIHAKPNRTEVMACRVWLDAEIALVRPQAVVALGATAAAAMLGPSVRVTRDRAKPIASALAPFVSVTVHPSSILRAPDSRTRAAERKQFVADLRAIARAAERTVVPRARIG